MSYFILSWVTFDVQNVVLYQGLDNHTILVEVDWSHQIAAFYGIQLDAICIVIMHFYDIDVFLIVFTTFQLNLAIIGQMVKK